MKLSGRCATIIDRDGCMCDFGVSYSVMACEQRLDGLTTDDCRPMTHKVILLAKLIPTQLEFALVPTQRDPPRIRRRTGHYNANREQSRERAGRRSENMASALLTSILADVLYRASP